MKVLGRGSIASWLEIALNVLGVFLWVALGGVVLGAIAYAVVMGLIAGGVLPAEFVTESEARLPSGGADVSLNGGVGMTAQVMVPGLLTAAIGVSGGLIIVNRLKRLFASFRSAEPFRKENATHLRVIWLTMMVIELSRYALHALTGVLIAALGQPSAQNLRLNFNVNLMTWAAILVLIVLAEVFREGARLREEQDLTI